MKKLKTFVYRNGYYLHGSVPCSASDQGPGGAGSWHEPVNSQARPDSPGAGAGYPGAGVGQSMYQSCKLQGPPSPPETKVWNILFRGVLSILN